MEHMFLPIEKHFGPNVVAIGNKSINKGDRLDIYDLFEDMDHETLVVYVGFGSMNQPKLENSIRHILKWVQN